MKIKPVMIFLPLIILLSAGTSEISEQNSLPIPPILEGEEVNLVIQKGELILMNEEGNSGPSIETLGYNGNYLGPTLRFRDKQDVNILIENMLKEETTVHWHGLHVPSEFDGGPHQVIAPESKWNPQFTIKQNAATLWYHPHLMGRTGEQVYRGLAGLFIIDDDYSDSLDIPKDYGVNDIPLILQDRRLIDGKFEYTPSLRDVMHGYIGNTILVNGALNPKLKRPGGTYRFRILNGSNSSIFRVSFSNEQKFTLIASDGGFLPDSVQVSSIILSPGERYEILADFVDEESISLITEVYGGSQFQVMDIEIAGQGGKYFNHPQSFEYSPVVPPDNATQRVFNMETGGMGRFSINGKRMDMAEFNFRLPRDSVEIWTIRNIGMGMMNIPHSFHVHDTQFTVLSVNGAPPPPKYAGPKDTVLLFAGDEIIIAPKFEEYTGAYMYHCHLLEHEDSGMMGQFLIE